MKKLPRLGAAHFAQCVLVLIAVELYEQGRGSVPDNYLWATAMWIAETHAELRREGWS